MSASNASTRACTDTSSAETGSSATRMSGRSASARAMPMRWRWPPENSCGNRSAADGSRPTSASSSRASAVRLGRRRAVDDRPLGDHVHHALARVERAVRVLEHHLHALADTAAAATARAGRCPARPAGSPRHPPAISRVTARASVLLPEPLSPTTPSVSPRRRSRPRRPGPGRAPAEQPARGVGLHQVAGLQAERRLAGRRAGRRQQPGHGGDQRLGVGMLRACPAPGRAAPAPPAGPSAAPPPRRRCRRRRRNRA